MSDPETKEVALKKIEGRGRTPGVQVGGEAGYQERKEEAIRKTQGMSHWGSIGNLSDCGQGLSHKCCHHGNGQQMRFDQVY